MDTRSYERNGLITVLGAAAFILAFGLIDRGAHEIPRESWTRWIAIGLAATLAAGIVATIWRRPLPHFISGLVLIATGVLLAKFLRRPVTGPSVDGSVGADGRYVTDMLHWFAAALPFGSGLVITGLALWPQHRAPATAGATATADATTAALEGVGSVAPAAQPPVTAPALRLISSAAALAQAPVSYQPAATPVPQLRVVPDNRTTDELRIGTVADLPTRVAAPDTIMLPAEPAIPVHDRARIVTIDPRTVYTHPHRSEESAEDVPDRITRWVPASAAG